MCDCWGGTPDRLLACSAKLNDAWDDIQPESLANTTAVMEGLWLFKRQDRYFLFGSHLTGYAPNDNFYLTAEHIMGPWTYQGLIAPNGTNTYNSQTFKGLTISGSKGEVRPPPLPPLAPIFPPSSVG